ncbi:MAG: hypothetical protein F4Y57_06005 [Acidobacteria bacterium]|nr:hypothetical protein [Acidobacteriota bacterium]
MKPETRTSLWKDLIERGAHLIRLHGKRPVKGFPWKSRGATLQEVVDHLASSPNAQIGVVPASLGAVVIDVDDTSLVDQAPSYGPEIGRYGTPSGGLHLWQAVDGALPNSKWEGGDVRGGDGYVVLWTYGPVTLSNGLLVRGRSFEVPPVRKEIAPVPVRGPVPFQDGDHIVQLGFPG